MNKRIPGKISKFALGHLFKKPATIKYPLGPLKVEDNYRGRLYFNAQDCIGCKLCVRDCPSNAIKINNVGSKEEKVFEMDLDLGRCIFCAQCAESCPKKCISFSQEIELATLDRDSLRLKIK